MYTATRTSPAAAVAIIALVVLGLGSLADASKPKSTEETYILPRSGQHVAFDGYLPPFAHHGAPAYPAAAHPCAPACPTCLSPCGAGGYHPAMAAYPPMNAYGAHMRFKEEGLSKTDSSADTSAAHAGAAAAKTADAAATTSGVRSSRAAKAQGTLQTEAHGPSVHEWSHIPTGQEDSRADAGLGAGGRAGPFFGMPRFASAYREGQRKAMEEVAKAERKAAGWEASNDAAAAAAAKKSSSGSAVAASST